MRGMSLYYDSRNSQLNYKVIIKINKKMYKNFDLYKKLFSTYPFLSQVVQCVWFSPKCLGFNRLLTKPSTLRRYVYHLFCWKKEKFKTNMHITKLFNKIRRALFFI